MEDALAVRRVDRLGVVLVAGGALATASMPFIIVKANRIAAGKPQLLTQLLGQPAALTLLVLLAAAALAALFLRNQIVRLGDSRDGLARPTDLAIRPQTQVDRVAPVE